MLAWPAGCVIVVRRLAPPALVALALVEAANTGAKASAPQPRTPNGLERDCVVPNVEVSVVSVESASQLVGSTRKLGRLTATVNVRSRTGTPLTIVGTPPETLTRALRGSTYMPARATTVPRSNGPATAGTAIERPKGPPAYGPVMNTAPEKAYGSAPAPAVTVAVPMRLPAEQVPCEACGSGHSSKLGIRPSSPSGSAVDTCARYYW